MARYDMNTTEGPIQAAARYIKMLVPDATENGITAICCCWSSESSCVPTRYEADYTGAGTANKDTPPTAEDIFGSWEAFEALYKDTTLDETIYRQPDGKHYIGYGLGQWTGARTKALYDWCKNNKFDVGTYEGQIRFAIQGEGSLSQLFLDVARSNDTVYNLVTIFGKNWEGNSWALNRYYAEIPGVTPIVKEELKNGDGKGLPIKGNSTAPQAPSEDKTDNPAKPEKKKQTGLIYLQNSNLWGL